MTVSHDKLAATGPLLQKPCSSRLTRSTSLTFAVLSTFRSIHLPFYIDSCSNALLYKPVKGPPQFLYSGHVLGDLWVTVVAQRQFGPTFPSN